MGRSMRAVAALATMLTTLTTPVLAQQNAPRGAADPPAQAGESAGEPASKVDSRESVSTMNVVPRATLRVQLVIQRFQQDRRQASMPYTFLVSTQPRGRVAQPGQPGSVRMRMGVDTPVPTVTVDAESGKSKETGFQYRNVGTNIDCWADDLGGGLYQLHLKVENSSALPAAAGPAGGNGQTVAAPLFRRFETSIAPVLKDGQTVQTVASTDPVTGEVVKIEVTMNAAR